LAQGHADRVFLAPFIAERRGMALRDDLGGAHPAAPGHTHGGQLCIPGYGALVSNWYLPTWRAKRLNGWRSNGHTTPVNVSGGIGTSRFAPVRIACRPEAALLTLTPPE
jgi:predicted MPP superfamily phosphohydrolase